MAALEHLPQQRVELGRRSLQARVLDRRAAVRVRLVHLHHRGLAVRHPLPVHLDFERGLASRQLRLLGLRVASHQAVYGELHELPGALLAQPLHVVAREQLGVTLVDGLDVELVLEPREVQVVLPVERGDELLGVCAIGGQVHRLPA